MKRIKGSRCTRMTAGLLAIILVFSVIFPSYIQAASDEFILEGNEEQALSEETSDESVLGGNEEQALSEETSDESVLGGNEEQGFSEETSDESVLGENEEQGFSEETSDELILGENEIQGFSEETPDDSGMTDKQRKSGISVLAKMKPATSEAIYTGNSGYFNLEVGVNDPNKNGTATVHVYIKDPNAILPQFENTIGKSITTDNGHVITLMQELSIKAQDWGWQSLNDMWN